MEEGFTLLTNCSGFNSQMESNISMQMFIDLII